MTQDRIDGNALIAEFDGWVQQPDFVNSDEEVFPYYKKVVNGKENFIHYHPDTYHSSWGWLMPVIEKINKTGQYRVRIFFDANGTNPIYNCWIDKVEWKNNQLEDTRIVGRSGTENPKNIVWLTVVEFLKWKKSQS